MADSPPCAITPAILARMEEIGEAIGRADADPDALEGALCRYPG